MHMNLEERPPPHHRPGSRRMIEMNMSQQHRPRLLFPNRIDDGLKRRLRPRINQRPINLPTTDHMGAPQVHHIYNAHPRQPTGAGGRVGGPSPLLPADPSRGSPYATGDGNRESASSVCLKPSSNPRGEYPSSFWAFS